MTLSTLLPLLLVSAFAALIPLGVHLGFRAPRSRNRVTPASLGLAFEAVRIPTVRGRTLAGWLLPAPHAVRTVILLHGWGSNAEAMLPLALPLRRAGLNVLLFDARNHGDSDADTFSSLPRFAEDLGKVIDWLKGLHPMRAQQVAVLGHSVGAGAALFEATRNRAISAVISIAAFADPDALTERYLRRLRLPRVVTLVVIRYVEWLIGHRFETIAPVNTIRRVPCPVLLVHGERDRVVPPDDARRIAARANASRVRLVEIPAAGHDSTDKIEQHAGILLEFLETAWEPTAEGRREAAPGAEMKRPTRP